MRRVRGVRGVLIATTLSALCLAGVLPAAAVTSGAAGHAPGRTHQDNGRPGGEPHGDELPGGQLPGGQLPGDELHGGELPGGKHTRCATRGPVLRYLVLVTPGATRAAATRRVRAACGRLTGYYRQIGVGVAVSRDPGLIRRFGRDAAYSAHAPGTATRPLPRLHRTDRHVSPADRAAAQWDMRMLHTAAAHRVTDGSRRVLVGVLDSGIDRRHPDLRRALDPRHSAGCVTGVPRTVARNWTPSTSSHGTHVAGLIAAADDGRGITGVAPGVRLASVKVVDDAGFIYPEAVVCGLMWAARNHMPLTSNSYTVDPWRFTCADEPGQHVVYAAVRRALDYARAHGVLSVAAASNTGVDLTSTHADTGSPDNARPADRLLRAVDRRCAVLPGGLPGTVTVAAVGPDEVKAGYSAYGLGAIDVAAPGGVRGRCVLSTVPGGYRRLCGTSMAVPHVTGVLALLASRRPRAAPDELVRALTASATPAPCPTDYDLSGHGVQDGFCAGYRGYNGFYGHGITDAAAAVHAPTARALR